MPQPVIAPPTRLTRAGHTACPSLLQLVSAVDGELCRVKLPGGELSAAQAQALAAAAQRYASGVLEITNRSNLQLRGVRAEARQSLIADLCAAGLGPQHSTDPAQLLARDQRRNLLLSPLAGIDPAQYWDVRPLAAKFLAGLQADASLDRLSPKFACLLHAGEQLADLSHHHDLWLAAEASQPVAGESWLLGLAGAPGDDGTAVGRIHRREVVPSLLGLLRAFISLSDANSPRMRDLLQRDGRSAGVNQLLSLAHQYGATIQPLDPSAPIQLGLPRGEPMLAAARLGAHPQRQAGFSYVGFQARLARLQTPQLRGLAALAERYGQARLRFNPWQGGLLPDIPQQHVKQVLAALDDLDLLTSPASPLTRILACAGSQGCARTQADTKADALRLAHHYQGQASLHLSGCPRRCAAASPAAFTLLAVDAEHYDLYRRDHGDGFGQRLDSHLTLQQAAVRLTALGAESLDV